MMMTPFVSDCRSSRQSMDNSATLRLVRNCGFAMSVPYVQLCKYPKGWCDKLYKNGPTGSIMKEWNSDVIRRFGRCGLALLEEVCHWEGGLSGFRPDLVFLCLSAYGTGCRTLCYFSSTIIACVPPCSLL